MSALRTAATHLRRVRAPGASLMRVRTSQPLIAVTFDDGPDERVTPLLLHVLRQHHARATFFVLTRRARQHPDLIHQALAEGHQIALHGADHRRLTTVARGAAVGHLRAGRDELAAVTGTPVRWYRPPYGAQSARLAWSARRLGLRPVLWSATTWDWKDVSAEQRLGKSDAVSAGDIVLAHDGHAGAHDGAIEPADAIEVRLDKAALLDDVLTRWSQRGLRAVTLDTLLAAGRPVWELRFPT